ncbi:SANT and BTB domain regulator of class switch recombination isoform X3 [Nematostella vectensis]|uniref:SANT and BTB domain regulator of class switch recombination isoform X3 n=1 Tax=Nematostella vectensis TaxID=45351 RepID=UPI0020776D3D|nr:SANT and BTB domain regulator of class switch recombination isoform X3 [Nematostella vectensis]
MMASDLAVDLVLRALMSSCEFRLSEPKDWEVISKLVPGATPEQCSKRWRELQITLSIPGIRGPSMMLSSGKQNLSKLLKSTIYHDAKETINARETAACGNKTEEPNAEQRLLGGHEHLFDNKDLKVTHYRTREAIRETQVSLMHTLRRFTTLHLYIQAHKVKQDFTCPRDLLIREMRYFAEYLSVEAQRWEEVDISVHCDVQIFDWLMKYVKKGLMEKGKKVDEKPPKLEPNNVISILISSDFLKMDNLVNDCISFCHENMSAIVSTPCNMNCINDKLVTRISELFNHNELDEVKDRKDKFKSKLFCKKIEELFDPNKTTICSPASACTMYRCSACHRLITQESQERLRCALSRMTIDHRGRVTFSHVRDPNWDVNEYIQGLREKFKSWRDVYWRLWGSVNILYCYRCGEYFPCCELGHCRYHTSSADFGSHKGTIVGVYPCCQQRVLPFDPTGQLAGCSHRDHRVSRNTPSPATANPSTEAANEEIKENIQTNEGSKIAEAGKAEQPPTVQPQGAEENQAVVNNPVVVDDLHNHRSLVVVPFQRLHSARLSEINVFGVEETAHSNQPRSTDLEVVSSVEKILGTTDSRQQASDAQSTISAIRRARSRAVQQRARKMRLPSREDTEHDTGEDEDQPESTDTEPEIKGPPKPRPPRKVTSASRRDFSTFKSYKWDPQRSSRWNQDAQREEDQKRMSELVTYLTRQRQHQAPQQEKDKQKMKEFAGGLYSKLEFQFRAAQTQVNNKPPIGSSLSFTGQRGRKQIVK